MFLKFFDDKVIEIYKWIVILLYIYSEREKGRLLTKKKI